MTDEGFSNNIDRSEFPLSIFRKGDRRNLELAVKRYTQASAAAATSSSERQADFQPIILDDDDAGDGGGAGYYE